MTGLVLNDVVWRGARGRVVVENGTVYQSSAPHPGRTVDCRGGVLLPGLCDHHLHLLGEAAQRQSLDLSAAAGTEAALIRAAAARGPVRATGLVEADGWDRHRIDAIAPDVPVRIAARTGGLWVLNSMALDQVLSRLPTVPDAFERGADGHPNGRVWRGDVLLRGAASALPDLAPIGADLARWGVTSVTDASVTTDQAQAARIAGAAMGALPQRLCLMSGGALEPGSGFAVGPGKILIDDADLPPLDDMVHRIVRFHNADRNVGVHCVTPAELAMTLAAFAEAGVRAGDRIEHGAMVSAPAAEEIARMGLTVVANPAFLRNRGDRYLAQLDAQDRADLIPLRRLIDGGCRVLGGSDAPYGPLNPWEAIAAATDRATGSGAPIGAQQAILAEEALGIYANSPFANDVVVLKPGAVIGIDEDPVALTVIGGKMVYQASSEGIGG